MNAEEPNLLKPQKTYNVSCRSKTNEKKNAQKISRELAIKQSIGKHTFSNDEEDDYEDHNEV